MELKNFRKSPIGTVFKFAWNEKWESVGGLLVKINQKETLTVWVHEDEDQNELGHIGEIDKFLCQFLFKAPERIKKLFNIK